MYGLPITDRYEVKRIAGRIIPAIATTTAAVAGLVSLEVLKYICFSGTPTMKERLVSESRNNFVNLALPSVLSVFPGPCTFKSLPNGEVFTVWDRWEMELPSKITTLKEFIYLIKVDNAALSIDLCHTWLIYFFLQSKLNLNVSLITQSGRSIYMTFVPKFQIQLQKP